MCFDGRRPEAGPLMRAAREAGRRVTIPGECPTCSSREISSDDEDPTWWYCHVCEALHGARPGDAAPPPAPGDGPVGRGTRAFEVGDRVVKDPAGWVPSEIDAWGAGEGVGEVVAVPSPGCVAVRWPAGRAYQRPGEILPAPAPAAPAVEDRGTPVWVWRDEHGWLSFWRMPGAVERCVASVPIGWRMRPDPDLGVVLADPSGDKLTAAAMWSRAERGEGGFRARGRECLR